MKCRSRDGLAKKIPGHRNKQAHYTQNKGLHQYFNCTPERVNVSQSGGNKNRQAAHAPYAI